MKSTVLCLGLLLALAAIGAAQVPTVDNFTLEKYQKQRVAAQRDYEQNYARMGFPSPEELDRQRDADMAARMQLADQLRQSRLEEEKIDLQRRGLDLQAQALDDARAAAEANYDAYNNGYTGYAGGYSGYGTYYPGAYGGGYGYGGYGRLGNGRFGRYRNGYGYGGAWPALGGYRASPVGVYPSNNGIPLPMVRQQRRAPYVNHYYRFGGKR
jgi:hypothetical protein